ncbi:TonB-dependent receptor [Dyella sedimenti]|uniref:TonB-dependent receptor n=1 Tax=Dyella sedimenti TaxID=2919947 RepID=UPI001FAB0968|nr:TonB-dependent receptor [Dyella sedimenti]
MNGSVLLRRSTLAMALAMGFTGAVHAQSTTGSIFGQAEAGQTIVISNDTGFARQVTVDSSGRYRVTNLPLGTYTVTLQKDGATVDTRRNIGLTVNAGTEVSFASVANATQLSTVTVTANTLPPIDVSTVDSRTVITAEELQHLPITRTAEAIAMLSPGVVQGSGFFTGPMGTPLVSVGGSSVTENAYYINGMNVTDPLSGLGGITLPYGAIAQQETLNGGYGAMYGRSDGGVINQIGKRGTNEWHFGGQVLWTPESLRADPHNIRNSAGTLYQYRNANKGWNTTANAYAGGPLIKDKLFFFVAGEASKSEDTYVDPASAGILRERTYRDPRGYVKLDWNINDNNILEWTGASSKHSYDGDIYEFDNDARSKGDYLSGDTHTKASASMWIAKYTGYITDNLTLSAQYGKQKTDLYTELAPGFDPSLIYVLNAGNQNPALSGGGVGIGNTQSVDRTDDPAHQTKGANYRLDLSYVLGDHTLTVGIDNQRTQDLSDGQYVPTDAGYMWNYGRMTNPNSGIVAGQVDAPANYPGGADGYYVSQYFYRTAASVRVEQRAQYIEDSWQVSDRWLLKLGLRNDQFTNYNSDGNPYIRQTKPQWAPRLGFAWDVNGDSSFKVYGNAGRYYLAMPTSVALRGASGSLYTNIYYTYTGIDPATGYPTGLTPIDTIKGPGVPISANNEYGQAPDPRTVTATSLKAQYQDEYILGFDKQFNESWAYGAKLTYRSLKNAIDDTCNYQLFFDKANALGLDTDALRGCYFFNPGRAATFQLPDGQGGLGQFTVTNAEMGFPKLKRNYYALELFLDHPFDGKWQGRLMYTFSRSYGNTEGQVKSDIGQDDVAATQDWDYPSLMQYASGRQHNDHTHQIKAYGAYQFTKEWNLSGFLSLISGAPTNCSGYYGPDQTTPAYPGPYYHWCDGRPAPAGTAGDLPWQKNLSLNLEYRPNFADNKLAFSLYANNVFNWQTPTYVYEYYLEPNYRRARGYSNPRSVRLGVSYDF